VGEGEEGFSGGGGVKGLGQTVNLPLFEVGKGRTRFECCEGRKAFDLEEAILDIQLCVAVLVNMQGVLQDLKPLAEEDVFIEVTQPTQTVERTDLAGGLHGCAVE
jgi:hypothetical protein